MREEWRFPNRATPVGSSAYYSVRFAPAPLRDDLAAVLAWHREVRSIVNEVSDPGVARMKLQWWREELERTYVGQPRHPLSEVLRPVVERHRLPADTFRQMADGVESEILRRQPADRRDLEDTCKRNLGALFELLTRCYGPIDPDLMDTASGAGAYCARIYLIRDSGALVRKGHHVFRSDLLREQGISTGAFVGPDRHTSLPGLLAAAARDARSAMPPRDRIRLLPATVRIRVAILDSLLDELEHSDFDLADQRIGLTPLRKLWLAWRENRRRQA